jgi:hypothetical protein
MAKLAFCIEESDAAAIAIIARSLRDHGGQPFANRSDAIRHALRETAKTLAPQGTR